MAAHAKHARPLGHTLIALGKLVKVVLLLTVGSMALAMAGHDPPAVLMHWADMLRVDPGSHHLHRLIGSVSGISAHKLEAIGFGTFAYAALFSVEGIGLWMQKSWAETLTLVITISFIPLEIYEIVHHTHWGKIVTLVLNIAAAIYLVVRVRRRGKEGDQGSEGQSSGVDGATGNRSAPAV